MNNDLEYTTKIINNKEYQFIYPVKRYTGNDQRGLKYNDYVMEVTTEVERHMGVYKFYVWRNGDWSERRVTIDWSARKNDLKYVAHYPRSFYPVEAGEIALLYRLPIRIVSILPAGKYSLITYVNLSIPKVDNQNMTAYWDTYNHRINNPSRIQKLDLEQLFTADPTSAGYIVEANLRD